MRSREEGRWFVGDLEARRPLRLVCVPHAGGAPSLFAPWRGMIAPDVDVMVASLPGRGARLLETPWGDLRTIAERLAADLVSAPVRTTVLFGHSMGAVIAFELAIALEAAGRSAAALVVSGCVAPDELSARVRRRSTRTDQELVEELRRIGGTPREVLDHPELMALVLPAIRADFEALESYVPHAAVQVDAPIAAFAGDADADAPPDRVSGWARFTRGGCAVSAFPGGHFFVETATAEVARAVSQVLTNAAARR